MARALAVVALCTGLALTQRAFAAPVQNDGTSSALPCAGETYKTRGVVKGISGDRKLVNIAHEKIEGYMMAMTMGFEPRSLEQVAALKPGDKVRFTFTATDDGRRVIDSITVE